MNHFEKNLIKYQMRIHKQFHNVMGSLVVIKVQMIITQTFSSPQVLAHYFAVWLMSSSFVQKRQKWIYNLPFTLPPTDNKYTQKLAGGNWTARLGLRSF